MIRIQYLGTGAAEGYPGLFCECRGCRLARERGGRNIKARSCTLINEDTMIDLSQDLFGQSSRFGIRLSGIKHLVVTHTHADHLNLETVCLRAKPGATILPGLPEEENYLNIYGSRAVGVSVSKALQEKPNVVPGRIHFHEAQKGRAFKAGSLTFIPFPANHRQDEECYIYAVTDGERWLLYANDTGTLPEWTLEQIRTMGICFHAVSMDCGRGTLPGDGHMGVRENIELRDRLREMGAVYEDTKYYLNHLSHMSGIIHDELQELMEPEGFDVAYDGMAVRV